MTKPQTIVELDAEAALKALVDAPDFNLLSLGEGVEFETPESPSKAKHPGRLLAAEGVTTSTFTRKKQIATQDFSAQRNAMEQWKRLPTKAEALHAITDGSYNGTDIIPAILTMEGSIAVEVWITTLGFSNANIEILGELLDKGKVKAIKGLVCSSYFAKASAQIFEYAVLNLREKRGIRLINARCHAKTLLIKTTKGSHFVVETSANLRSAICIEALCLQDDAALYEFHKTWINRLIISTEAGSRK